MRATALYPSRISQQSGPASGGAFLALTVASASSASKGCRICDWCAFTLEDVACDPRLLGGGGLARRRFLSKCALLCTDRDAL
jgi:hypothetical protein